MSATATAAWDRPGWWSEVVGQPAAVAQLSAAAHAPVHAYLLVGPAGSGARAAARAFAAALLTGADPAGAARHHQLALAGRHPSVIEVERTGPRITAEQAREIVRRSALRPAEGERQVMVLVDFHLVTDAGPILLKAIEEPPPGTVFVVLAEEVPPELVTIASRCVRIDLGPVPRAEVVAALVADGAAAEVAEAAADAAGGDLARARLLVADPTLAERRQRWWSAPERLDGTGAAVARLVDALLAGIDEAAGPLEERHGAERAALEERVAQTGERGSGRKELEDRQKRELRRHRTDELRFGLATLAARYRSDLAEADPAAFVAAARAIQGVAESLVHNRREDLALQALFLDLPPR